MTMTGEGVCPACKEPVLLVRNHDDGRLVRLDTARTDGGWEPMMDRSGVIVARYVAPGSVRERHGHHAHDLRCAQARHAVDRLIDESRARINARLVERPQTRRASSCGESVMLPVLTPSGVRALAGASS